MNVSLAAHLAAMVFVQCANWSSWRHYQDSFSKFQLKCGSFFSCKSLVNLNSVLCLLKTHCTKVPQDPARNSILLQETHSCKNFPL